MFAKAIGTFARSFVDGVIVLNSSNKVLWYELKENLSFTIDLATDINKLFKRGDLHFYHQEEFYIEIQDQPLQVAVQRLEEPEPLVILCIKEFSFQLDNNEARLYCLEEVIQTIDEGVMMSNSVGDITLYNAAQEKMEGLNAQEIIGRPLWDAYNYNPQFSEHRHVFSTGKPIFSRYRAHSKVDGVPQYVSYSTFPIKKDGETIGVFSISTNESKLKDQLYQTIELKRSKHQVTEEKAFSSNGTIFTFEDIKGQSTELKALLREAQAVSVYNTDTLIVGETGTGKELFAQSMHNHSSRRDKPFVAINCAAIPENLLESTLFGTIKGAFTGATDQIGLFEYAGEGTLFMDEINSMPMTLQSKLMRVLQERLVRRVGSNDVTPVRCTVISASNEDPERLIEEERMRLDLFYRVANTSLFIPPLRDRPEDILFFINYFLEYFQEKMGTQTPPLSPSLRDALLRYSWPGNIRELEHLMQNIVIRVNEDAKAIEIQHLPSYIRGKIISEQRLFVENGEDKASRPIKSLLNQSKKQFIQTSLEQTEWNISEAARRLGITRQSLQYHIKKHQLEKP
ncbi:sigma-54-dependent Fis family transcriptional regulator [Sporosarcina sp. P21c]|uniref:sigma-54 interaction domain-containing protein n=1 Tax=unclassified Sporosarcina TaxID=2647733 RepID=UPI000C173513|nr:MULTISPECIES: sigma 54-interacting transcriptional regulator [unclassified Sporosarcina]PIC66124.1 sigma-54-dependent Fis family transcriptional regulator [Sporosarcina sp. P16a]PIC88655.1 sigma-54-dependent Fis family transcriptional regulator [Sporosarcina sp. P21c]PIC91726.1 sigma-54-dependent Fis family transcriptional regulator [Sporosarcina sp. P25]